MELCVYKTLDVRKIQNLHDKGSFKEVYTSLINFFMTDENLKESKDAIHLLYLKYTLLPQR